MKIQGLRWWVRSFAVVAVVIAAALSAARLQQSISEDPGFKNQTGITLPANVLVVAYASEVNDNLFHVTHYWLLKGPTQAVRGLTGPFGLTRSDEDAAWALPDMRETFSLDLGPADVVEGYEGAVDGGRDHWLVIFSEGRGALLIY